MLAVAPLRLPIGGDVPRAERVDVADLNAGRDAEQSVDELLHVRRRQPGRAQPHVNFSGGQIRWLHRFQRLDIFAEARVIDAGGIGGDKFFADIAGKIMVFGFPLFGLRVEKNHALQVGQKFRQPDGPKAAMWSKSTRPFSFSETSNASLGRTNGLNRLFDGGWCVRGKWRL